MLWRQFPRCPSELNQEYNHRCYRMRDDFSSQTKNTLGSRVGWRCSNPDCNQLTSGPCINSKQSVNIGVAAHISAAASGGPRYDGSINSDQRSSLENGIWLCQNCAKLIDNDPMRYTTELLTEWKYIAEKRALTELQEKPKYSKPDNPVFRQVNAAVMIQGKNAINISGPNAVYIGPGGIKIVGPVVKN